MDILPRKIPFFSISIQSANYNEGFKSYNRDDKASYSYGKGNVVPELRRVQDQ